MGRYACRAGQVGWYSPPRHAFLALILCGVCGAGSASESDRKCRDCGADNADARCTFQIPLLGTKIGLDALIGMVPGAGDAIAAGIAAWIVNEGRLLGAPRWLLARMAWNMGVDLFGGAIPLAGDLFDVDFKCNRRNVNLLSRWLHQNGFVPDVA